jgi:hypothetical protein
MCYQQVERLVRSPERRDRFERAPRDDHRPLVPECAARYGIGSNKLVLVNASRDLEPGLV